MTKTLPEGADDFGGLVPPDDHDPADYTKAGRLRATVYEAEIARLPENRAGGVTAATIRVPLDSTYLFADHSGNRVASTATHADDFDLCPAGNITSLCHNSSLLIF